MIEVIHKKIDHQAIFIPKSKTTILIIRAFQAKEAIGAIK
jgi:hypothetical protein